MESISEGEREEGIGNMLSAVSMAVLLYILSDRAEGCKDKEGEM